MEGIRRVVMSTLSPPAGAMLLLYLKLPADQVLRLLQRFAPEDAPKRKKKRYLVCVLIREDVKAHQLSCEEDDIFPRKVAPQCM